MTSPPEPNESLASYIRRLRLLASLSQKELANRSRIHLQSLGKIETGKTKRLNQKTLRGLAYALSITAAIERLRPRLISLLAGRILQLTLSSEAARLQVATSVVPTGDSAPAIANGVQQFKTGTTMQVKVRNNEQRNLHIAVLVIGATGNLTVLYPYWDAPDIASLVPPGQELAVPKADDPYQFRLRGTSGFVEVLVLATTKPLRQSLQTLEAIGRGRGLESRSFTPLQENEPLDIIESLVGDLDRNTRGDGDIDLVSTRSLGAVGRAVDTTQLATISHVIEVVAS